MERKECFLSGRLQVLSRTNERKATLTIAIIERMKHVADKAFVSGRLAASTSLTNEIKLRKASVKCKASRTVGDPSLRGKQRLIDSEEKELHHERKRQQRA